MREEYSHRDAPKTGINQELSHPSLSNVFLHDWAEFPAEGRPDLGSEDVDGDDKQYQGVLQHHIRNLQ